MIPRCVDRAARPPRAASAPCRESLSALISHSRHGHRPRRAREVVEAKPEDDRATQPAASPEAPRTRSTMAMTDESISSRDLGRRPSARCEPMERRRRPTRPASDRGCARARGGVVPPRGRGGRRARLLERATWPTVVSRGRAASRPSPALHPRAARPAAGGGTRARRPGDDEEPVRLRDRARDLREELRPRDADGDRQPDLVEHAPPQPAAMSVGAPAAVRARVRRGMPRRSRALRRAASCPRTPRTPPCSPPSRRTSAAARRRRGGRAASPAARPLPS